MAIFLLDCKEMATRVKKLLIWMVLFIGWFRQWYHFNSNLMLSNTVGLLHFILQQFKDMYAYQSHYSGLCIFGAMF